MNPLSISTLGLLPRTALSVAAIGFLGGLTAFVDIEGKWLVNTTITATFTDDVTLVHCPPDDSLTARFAGSVDIGAQNASVVQIIGRFDSGHAMAGSQSPDGTDLVNANVATDIAIKGVWNPA